MAIALYPLLVFPKFHLTLPGTQPFKFPDATNPGNIETLQDTSTDNEAKVQKVYELTTPMDMRAGTEIPVTCPVESR